MGRPGRSRQAGRAPAFEQQSPEQLISVLRPDLVIKDEAV